jgi:peptide chain release factor 2
MAETGFWDNASAARAIVQEKSKIEREMRRWQEMERAIEDIGLLIDLSHEEGDTSVLQEIHQGIDSLSERSDRLRIEVLLSGDKDINNAIVAIHPGAGGTESQDWAQMLLRMYTRWAERQRYGVEVMDLQPGDEAGIKSATFSVNGEYAFGYLKSEAGVHRLVRISPFDANKRRHTSFASVFVYPEIDDDISVVIDDKDLRIDTYRASSAGGQHVNKTSSAIRITHIPTNIVVQCQNERSQHKNKAFAMKVLKARLYELEREKKIAERSALENSKKDIAWGSQIRSYVFQPYQMVKDHRTGHEVGNVTAVMDGDLDALIKAFLLKEAPK